MRIHPLGITVLAVGLLAGLPTSQAATFKLDPDHTTVGFKIRHLLAYVRGTFNEFEGTIEYQEGQPASWRAQAIIQTASIDTGVEQRDNHLRSKEFFDVETYPTMTFTSTGVTVQGGRTTLHGLLTIRGIARPVVLDLEIHGVAKDPWGKVRSGFTATTTINRTDYGLIWNQILDTGQLLVGEDVDIILEVEGLQVEE